MTLDGLNYTREGFPDHGLADLSFLKNLEPVLHVTSKGKEESVLDLFSLRMKNLIKRITKIYDLYVRELEEIENTRSRRSGTRNAANSSMDEKEVRGNALIESVILGYCMPRLFSLSYLAAWSLFESYLESLLRTNKEEEENISHSDTVAMIALDLPELQGETAESEDEIRSKLRVWQLSAQIKVSCGIDLTKNHNFERLVSKRTSSASLHADVILNIDQQESLFSADNEYQATHLLESVSARLSSIDDGTKPLVEQVWSINRRLEADLCEAILGLWWLAKFVTERGERRSCIS